MQTPSLRAVVASLVLVIVVLFAWGIASAVSEATPHAAPPSSSTNRAPSDFGEIQQGLAQFLHPQWAAPSAAAMATTDVYSYNWAGYAAEPSAGGSTYSVQGNWYVPTVTCGESGATKVAYTVQWIGIDGYSTTSVEQIGSAEYCSGHGAVPEYFTWWEFAGYDAIQYAYATTPGAYISASVIYDPAEYVAGVQGVWTLNLYDFDNGVAFSVTASDHALGFSPSDLGAECISEAPFGDSQTSSGFYLLAHFTPTTFYGCAAAIGTHAGGIGNLGTGATLYKIEMCNDPACNKILQSEGGLLVDPGAPQYGKSEFKVTWKGYS